MGKCFTAADIRECRNEGDTSPALPPQVPTDPTDPTVLNIGYVDCDGKCIPQGERISLCPEFSDGSNVPTDGEGHPVVPRVRAARTGEPLFPTSATHGPDQLIGIEDDSGNDYPFNPSTGKFTVELGQAQLLDCTGDLLPGNSRVPGCPVFSDGSPVPVNPSNQPIIPLPTAMQDPTFIRQGNFNTFIGYDPGPWVTPSPAPLNSLVVASGTIGTITNPDPVNNAIIVGTGQSDAVCALESPIPDLDRSFSIEFQVSFDGITWQKVHENGWSVRSTSAVGLGGPIHQALGKNVSAQALVAPSSVTTVLYRVMLNDFNTSAATPPPQVALRIANFQWRLHSAHDVS